MEIAADGFFPSDMVVILLPSTTSLVDVARLLCFLVPHNSRWLSIS
jgi:hypothetical protein